MPEAKPKQNAEKKPSNLIRVNNSMIHDIKDNDNRKAITVGIKDPDGTKTVGTIYVGAKSIMADKKTATLPDSQKKSYIGISRDKDYDFVTSYKDANGQYKNHVDKMKGGEIVDKNHAYMADKRADYKKQAEAKAAEKSAEAQAAGPEVG